MRARCIRKIFGQQDDRSLDMGQSDARSIARGVTTCMHTLVGRASECRAELRVDARTTTRCMRRRVAGDDFPLFDSNAGRGHRAQVRLNTGGVKSIKRRGPQYQDEESSYSKVALSRC